MKFFSYWMIATVVVLVIMVVANFFKSPDDKKHGAKAAPRRSPAFQKQEQVSGGYKYDIKGINFRDLDDSYLGDFIGTARALKSNQHDPYAIGIYIGSRRVGFLPRGNSQLHAEIMAVGGSVGVEGYIARATDEQGRSFYYGKVNIL